ncbi:2-C-methyl-D-erythritol 4-phosphate cytidylyltransferase [soil metagenome]
MGKFAVIFPASGRSTRFGGKEKKPFTNLDGRAVWLRSVEAFVSRDEVCQCIIVVSAEDQELFRHRYGPNLAFMNIQIATGGAERFESVNNALAMLQPEAEFVAIHDAVRPCIMEEHITAVFQRARETGAAILAVPVADTLKKVNDAGKIEATMPRAGLWQAQTPQVFRRDLLVEAYSQRSQLTTSITDDAQLVEAMGHAVSVLEGSPQNLKITTKSDVFLAEMILKSRPKPQGPRQYHPFADEDMWGGSGS